jgi:hypothetical protein
MEKENMVISALNLLIDLVIRADGLLLAKYHVVAVALIVSIVVSVIFIGQYFGMLCTKMHKAVLSYRSSEQIKARNQARSAVMVRPAVVKTKQGLKLLASVHIGSDGMYVVELTRGTFHVARPDGTFVNQNTQLLSWSMQ